MLVTGNRLFLHWIHKTNLLLLSLATQADKKSKNVWKDYKHIDDFWMLTSVPNSHPDASRKVSDENDHFLYVEDRWARYFDNL